MSAKTKVVIFLFVLIDVLLVLWILAYGKTIAILQPQGIIARQEKTLLLTVLLSGLAVIIPTILLFFFFVFRYRENNTKRQHLTEWSDNRLQFVMWTIPCVIVCVLIVVIWQSTHALDPFKELQSTVKPLRIQVVALRWKWLFIYPEYNIATINYIAIPQKTPVTFELTADAPMNSFWIPQLGGQMYAMEGMVNRTHLMADTTGEFRGASTEISGEGFASMGFVVKATTNDEFNKWVEEKQRSNQSLTWQEYTKLAKPSTTDTPLYYSLGDENLYNEIVQKFLPPANTPRSDNMAENGMQKMHE